ncbi:adenylyl-sulfate kinase [Aliifodinibius sp. S!AR15-10]|uniref:adenylyl-sulfate kinase n=1 Tax=Aliifodinibius sp. S!AR15-10 TaxID=2950437 RepID=UPI002854C5B4|nr:adenylyl-sulfate kinase [Aliifodinibius sp. S!AR15-10]MDR8393510.1 adenylyl-sulfate kinase [Aliifodinibius sp. S!AR15-10]
MSKNELKPTVLWFTGLSGSGKSTVSEKVYAILKERGLKVEHLDGDAVREVFPTTGFSKEERDSHVKKIGFVASLLQKHGVFVVASFISPYQDARDFVRNMCEDFTEVFISTPLEECERRDVKGLYEKARAGEIDNFTGISDPYEEPENPELNIDTTDITVDEAVQQVIDYLESR